MALTPVSETREVSFSLLERQHTKRAVELYIKSLERSRNNELAGSDIWRFRGQDIDLAKSVLSRLS